MMIDEFMMIDELLKKINEAAWEVRQHLMPGYLENVYKNALLFELRTRGLKADSEVELNVLYKGVIVGKYRADILVEDCVILEIKAVGELLSAHTLQLLNYLTTTNIEHGILINYGTRYQFHHKTLHYLP